MKEGWFVNGRGLGKRTRFQLSWHNFPHTWTTPYIGFGVDLERGLMIDVFIAFGPIHFIWYVKQPN